ncbi:hypothetical protein ACQEVZ_27615 [Dactylosporangium sp. CA-152071]|uniref:hypothetical protein n=1 Tax=Dactylosporangium sp. CA-152071 TaxID=3239933 RepID=UPI003D90689E
MRAADDLEIACDEPISIAFVGEYSTGKSLLLGTLLGTPELLPVANEPTTGNVTALQLVPGPADAPVELRDASLSLLSLEQISACAAFILRKMTAVVAARGLRIETDTLQRYDPVSEGWSRFEQWCRKHLWPPPSDTTTPAEARIELRDSALELVRIRDALQRGKELVGATRPGAPIPITREDMGAALRIGGTRQMVDSFPELVPAAPISVGAGLNPSRIAELFPLIRRVTFRVQIPANRWPAVGLINGHRVEFLDFPGLNARGAARDDWLAASQLDGVHTIVLAVRADRPEVEVATRFLGLLDGHGRTRAELGDAVLTVANLFDLTRPPNEPVSTVERLRDGNFGSVYRTVRDLTGGKLDRVAFTSSLVAIERYRMPVDPRGELAYTLGAIGKDLQDSRNRWTSAARHLAMGSPQHPLTRAIEQFAQDGGVTALRELLSDHVRRHGAQLKVAGLVRRSAGLRQLVERFAAADQPRAYAGAPSSYDELFADLAQAADDLVYAVEDLRADTLRETLTLSVAAHVHRWSLWSATLATANGSGVLSGIAAARQQAAPVENDLRNRLRPPAAGQTVEPVQSHGTAAPQLLLRTEDLRKPFQDGLVAAASQAEQAIGDLFDGWIETQNKARNLLHEALTEPAARRALQAQLAVVAPVDGGARRMESLAMIAELSWTKQAVEGTADKICATLPVGPEMVDGVELDDLFPLRPRHLMPWHEHAPKFDTVRQNQAHRHEVRLLRARQEVVDALVHLVTARAVDELDRMRDAVRDVVRGAKADIPDDAQLLAIADAMADTEATGPTGRSPWRDLLDDWPTDDSSNPEADQ